MPGTGGLTGESEERFDVCRLCQYTFPIGDERGISGGWMPLKERVFLGCAGNMVGDVGNYNPIRAVCWSGSRAEGYGSHYE